MPQDIPIASVTLSKDDWELVLKCFVEVMYPKDLHPKDFDEDGQATHKHLKSIIRRLRTATK